MFKFSLKLLFSLNSFGGSGSILRPMRVSLGDMVLAGLLYIIVGLSGGESSVPALLVGLLSSNTICFFSKCSLRIKLSWTTVGEDLLEFVLYKFRECKGGDEAKLLRVGDCVRLLAEFTGDTEFVKTSSPLSRLTVGTPIIGPWSEYLLELNILGLCLLFRVGLIGGFNEE